MFGKLETEGESTDLPGGVKPLVVIDLIVREYTDAEFDESMWRMKWESFKHPHTGERGAAYLRRMKHMPHLNPELQKGSKKIIVVEPLYGNPL